MIDTVKALILDSQEAQFSCGIPRDLEWEFLPGKAHVFIGVRRSGKSTFMVQIMKKQCDEGISRQNMVHLNFFDDRLHSLSRIGLGVVSDAYFSLYPEKKGNETVSFYFDEIQVVPGWEKFIERLLRTEKCRIFLTGSSAHMLSREIATQMRGRALPQEVFPFSFAEFLRFHQIDAAEPLTTKMTFTIRKGFDRYWESGGFPEVAGISSSLRIRIHQDYLQAIMFRDLIDRHDISHPKALSDLIHRLIDNVSSPYTLNGLSGFLKSLGHKVPKSTISDYLAWMEDAYFLFTVKKFDASESRANANPKKLYCIDHALVSSVSSGVLTNSGHLLENLVFIHCRRSYQKITYYRTGSGKEVDFLVQQPNRTRALIQVCESLADPRTAHREKAALEEAMRELKLEKGLIVTRNEEGIIETPSGLISLVPAWKFSLPSFSLF